MSADGQHRSNAETTKAAPHGPRIEGRAGPLRVLEPLVLSVEDEVASHVRLPGGEPCVVLEPADDLAGGGGADAERAGPRDEVAPRSSRHFLYALQVVGSSLENGRCPIGRTYEVRTAQASICSTGSNVIF